jgi:membrane fusion protein, multidrug efflux system
MKIRHYIGIITAAILMNACSESNQKDAQLQNELQKIRNEIAELQQKEKELLLKLGSDENTRSKTVELSEMVSDTFINEVSVEGMVDAQSSTIATSMVPGTVTEILVRLGQTVKQGQVLARLESSSLVQSRRELQQQLDFAKTLFEKQQRLWQNGVGTEVQYLSAKNQMEALEKSLATLNTNIQMYQIKAPISGTVEAIDLKVGQMAAPGMPYFKVVNLAQTKVIGELSETYAGRIEAGDQAHVYFPDLQQHFECTIGFASKYIDPLNRTFKIEIPLSQQNIPGIKPNMIAKLNIIEFKKANTLVVPSNCVQTTEKESFVMLAVKEGNAFKAKKQLITLGMNNKNITEVLAGLKVGDQIITNGFQELAEGQILNIKQ